MTVKDIYNFIDRIAPFIGQEEYDNSGFLLGDIEREVKIICLCLDATNDVINEAKEKGADLIISHHPVIFKAVKSIHSSSPVFKLIQYGISYISLHTNFDAARGGLSDVMLELLEFPPGNQVIDPINLDGSGFGRIVEIDENIEPRQLAERCKKAFNCSVVRFTSGDKPIKKIAVSSGAGSRDLEKAIKKGCTAFITGDVKWSDFVYAKDHGITLIDAGHFHTENTFGDIMKKQLRKEFSGIGIFISEHSIDLCDYVGLS